MNKNQFYLIRSDIEKATMIIAGVLYSLGVAFSPDIFLATIMIFGAGAMFFIAWKEVKKDKKYEKKLKWNT